MNKPQYDQDIAAKVEALIFATEEPISLVQIAEALDNQYLLKDLAVLVTQLRTFYEQRRGGFCILERDGCYQFRTTEAVKDTLKTHYAKRPRPLSKAALETLAVIAYRQPATRADVEFVRGVDSGSIIKGLLERNLVKCVGRKQEAGKPMLFGITDEFFAVFAITNLKDLPPLESFQPNVETVKQALEKIESHEDIFEEISHAVSDSSWLEPKAGELEEVSLGQK